MSSRLTVYWHVWKMTAFNALQEAFINRWTNVIFLTGKSVRFGMALVFLLLIRNNVSQFSGYTTDQMIVFFLTYQFVDLLAQIFYRGAYLFGNLVRNGDFDFLLAKPISPLFRALTGKPDINDVVFMVPSILVSFAIASQLNLQVTMVSVFWYGILLVNSFLIVTSLHVLVMVVGILTTEVDGVIWLYRDLIRLGQFPVSVYLQPLQFALFFIVPIGLMITVPAEVLLNVQPTQSILTTLVLGVGSFFLSLRVWSWSLRQYSSASS